MKPWLHVMRFKTTQHNKEHGPQRRELSGRVFFVHKSLLDSLDYIPALQKIQWCVEEQKHRCGAMFKVKW
jgi:hypothetical protein